MLRGMRDAHRQSGGEDLTAVDRAVRGRTLPQTSESTVAPEWERPPQPPRRVLPDISILLILLLNVDVMTLSLFPAQISQQYNLNVSEMVPKFTLRTVL